MNSDGEDSLDGGAGDDSIVATGGEVTTDPGDVDFDTIDLSALSGAVTVTYTDDEAGTITFSEIEHLILTDQGDSVDGPNVEATSVDGADGNDTTIGGDTTNSVGDAISGGAGDDSITSLWGAPTACPFKIMITRDISRLP